MKVSIRDIKKAISWVEANTNSEMVLVSLEGAKMLIKTSDKYDKIVEIVIYDESTSMLPTITSTDKLR